MRPAVAKANEQLAKDGIAPIGKLGFHGLRRTYASLRCACGDDIAYTSSQIGHEDPRFNASRSSRRSWRRWLCAPMRRGQRPVELSAS
jgi:integrase